MVLFVIFLRVVQPLQHATQISDAEVKGNLLVLARVAIAQQTPHLARDAAALALQLFTIWNKRVDVFI